MGSAFRIGIAGLGTVGAGVIKLLNENAEIIALRAGRSIEIAAVSAQSKGHDRGVDLSSYVWVDKTEDLANFDGLDAVIELIGGEGTAKNLIEGALKNKRHVVTANKALLAKQGYELAVLAENNDVSLKYEAAVAGGIPVIKAMKESFAGNKILSIYGILNGTCNYILTEMRETGRSFDDVLKEAQAKGYAEADPTIDVDGIDAAHKLCILTAIGFGVKPDFDAIEIQGIRHIDSTDIAYAKEFGYRIKLLGVAKVFPDGKIMQVMEPCLVPLGNPMGTIEGVYNAVFIGGNYIETPLLTGLGAGEKATASSVVSDIIDLARGFNVPTFGIPASKLKTVEKADTGETINSYYLRLNVIDKPGVIADISAILRDKHISIEGLMQRGRDPGQSVPIIITSHETRHSDMLEAVELIAKLPCCVERPCLMAIEEI